MAPPASSRALGERLPLRERPTDERLLRLIRGDRELPLSSGSLRCSGGSRRAPQALLSSTLGSFAMSVMPNPALMAPGSRHWSDYEFAEARLLAWTLAYEPLLSAIGEALRCETPMPTALTADMPTPAATLDFRWIRDGDGGVDCEGQLHLDDAHLDALERHPQWRRHADAKPAASLMTRVTLCHVRLPPQEWASFETGDVLVLGTATDLLQRLSLDTGGFGSWQARLGTDRASVEIRAPLSRPTDESSAMTADPDRPDVDVPAPLALPQLDLRVELEQLRLTVDALQALQPGSVVALSAPLDDAPVTLRSAGQPVARGRLVAVGDTLGVELLDIAR